MRIKEIKKQHRLDFYASYECEHCGDIVYGAGYDDEQFHNETIPSKQCKTCRRSSLDPYQPVCMDYPDEAVYE